MPQMWATNTFSVILIKSQQLKSKQFTEVQIINIMNDETDEHSQSSPFPIADLLPFILPDLLHTLF